MTSPTRDASLLVRPEIVLFDVDGTLLDTREFILGALEHSLATLGLPVPSRDLLAEAVGPPLEQIYRNLTGAAFPPALVEHHRAFQAANLGLSVPFPGVVEVLGRLASAGVTMAAVTSRSRLTSVRTLELAGIASVFATIVSFEDAPATKPDPAPLLVAIERSGGTAGRRVAMVGDTEYDIRAGQRIGAFTVAALYGFGAEAALAAGPDRAIHDITELPAVLNL